MKFCSLFITAAAVGAAYADFAETEGNYGGSGSVHGDHYSKGHGGNYGEGHGDHYGKGHGDVYGKGHGHGDHYGKGHGDHYGKGHDDHYGEGHGDHYGKGHGDVYGKGLGHGDHYGKGHGDHYGKGHDDHYGEGHVSECEKKHGKGSWTCDDGCNTCSCGPNGSIQSTLKACVKKPYHKEPHHDHGKEECIKKHGGKQSWTCADGCNTCFCGSGGRISHTLKACVKKPYHKEPDYDHGKKRCIKKHGGKQSWTCADGCNTCFCGSGGRISHTLKACVKKPGGDYKDKTPPGDYSEKKDY